MSAKAAGCMRCMSCFLDAGVNKGQSSMGTHVLLCERVIGRAERLEGRLRAQDQQRTYERFVNGRAGSERRLD